MVAALSEDIGYDENSDLLISESHLRSVNNVIKGTSIEDLIEEDEQQTDEIIFNISEDSSGWTEWAKSIFESAEAISTKAMSGSVPNAFYNPPVAAKLKNLISYLPLWTGIMRSYFHCNKEIATSSAVEAAFDIKHRAFKGELPMRVDKFIIKHIDWLKGKISLSLANENTAWKEKIIAEESKNNMWAAVENWRGLTTKSVDALDLDDKPTQLSNKKRKLTYLDDCPDWEHMATLKRVTVPLLRNGSLFKGSRCGDQFVVVRQTCAFDSITQIVTNAIVTNKTYADITASQNNNFCNFAKSISLLNSNKITSNIYQERTKILNNVSIFETERYTRNIMHLNVNCNVAHLAEHLFVDFPSLIITKKCDDCNHENLRKISVLSINVDMLLQTGLSEIRNAILDTNHKKDSTCKKCLQIISENYDFKSHLLIDCSIYTDSRYITSIGIEKKNATLGSVPKILEFNQQQYIIAGVVSYHQYKNEENDGHYTAYIYDTTRWYLYDDMVTKRRIAFENENIKPHLIMHTTTNE